MTHFLAAAKLKLLYDFVVIVSAFHCNHRRHIICAHTEGSETVQKNCIQCLATASLQNLLLFWLIFSSSSSH